MKTIKSDIYSVVLLCEQRKQNKTSKTETAARWEAVTCLGSCGVWLLHFHLILVLLMFVRISSLSRKFHAVWGHRDLSACTSNSILPLAAGLFPSPHDAHDFFYKALFFLQVFYYSKSWPVECVYFRTHYLITYLRHITEIGNEGTFKWSYEGDAGQLRMAVLRQVEFLASVLGA